MIYLLAMLIGIVAGLRALTAPAAVSWAAYAGVLPVHGTWLSFLGFWLTPYILTVLAAVEFVTDQLPTTPSRKDRNRRPVGRGARHERRQLARRAGCGGRRRRYRHLRRLFVPYVAGDRYFPSRPTCRRDRGRDRHRRGSTARLRRLSEPETRLSGGYLTSPP